MLRQLFIETNVIGDLINNISKIVYTPFWSHLSVHKTALVLQLSWCHLVFSHP